MSRDARSLGNALHIFGGDALAFTVQPAPNGGLSDPANPGQLGLVIAHFFQGAFKSVFHHEDA